jgi:hypothetical protein
LAEGCVIEGARGRAAAVGDSAARATDDVATGAAARAGRLALLSGDALGGAWVTAGPTVGSGVVGSGAAARVPVVVTATVAGPTSAETAWVEGLRTAQKRPSPSASAPAAARPQVPARRLLPCGRVCAIVAIVAPVVAAEALSSTPSLPAESRIAVAEGRVMLLGSAVTGT